MNTCSDRRPVTGKALAWLLTLVYFSSYMTRKNFAVIIQEVITDTGFSKDMLSVVVVCMTITYGLGQIINGRLSDKFKPTNMILCGMVIATAVNLVFPFISGSVIAMAILWGINGYAQAMMWPPIVKILVANCDDASYGYSVVRISWGSSFATISLYLIAPLIIGLTGNWKMMFFVSAVVGLLSLLFWISVKSRVCVNLPTDTAQKTKGKGEKFRIPPLAVFPFVFIVLGIIFQGMLRDGVATWMPTYLAEVHGMSNETSILSAVFPAIFSILCFSISGTLYKKFFKNEVFCGALIFGAAVVAALVLFLFFGKSAVVATVCLTVITGCMHGVNLMLITHVPKRFKKYGNIATFAGLVNACTYVGEAVFTYGLAMMSKYSWRWSIFTCFAIAMVGTVCCLIAAGPWNKFSGEA